MKLSNSKLEKVPHADDGLYLFKYNNYMIDRNAKHFKHTYKGSTQNEVILYT